MTTSCPPATASRPPPSVGEVVLDHLWLAERLSRRFALRGEASDDLLQVARIGLLEAAQRYDPTRGEFTAFAATTITGVLKRHFRDHGWTVRPPRRSQELAQRIRQQWGDLAQSTGGTPSVADLAVRLDESVVAIEEGLRANASYRTFTLDAQSDARADQASESAAESFQHSDARLRVRQLLVDLDDDQRELLRLRFVDELSQREIGVQRGTTQMQVSRQLGRVLAQLRSVADADDGA